MIPKAYITEWSKNAPWVNNYQIEQDLIIEKAIVEIFSNLELNNKLAFRGGTALHKLFLKPQARYSEDIDLVQVEPGKIGALLSLIREQLSFLGKANFNASQHNATLIFKFESEFTPIIPLKLKVEINTREHFSVYDIIQLDFKIESSYYSGKCKIKTFTIEELLSTKLRALYQRKKGRDLFDLWYANEKVKIENNKVVKAFQKYISFENRIITSNTFKENVEEKLKDKDFIGDTTGLLRTDINYNISTAWDYVRINIVNKI